MEEIKKVISIQVNGEQTVKDLKDNIAALRDALVNIDKSSDDYNKVVDELVQKQTKLNEVMSAGKTQITAAAGSYNALQNQMSALKKVWKETTDEATRNRLGAQIKDINDQLKALDSSIGNSQRKVGSYEEAINGVIGQFKNERQELRALRDELEKLDPSTQAYADTFERASEITHNLQERQEMLRMSSTDLGVQLSNLSGIAAGMSAGFNAVNALMVLTGENNEDLQKSMVKLQAGIALVQGLQGIEGLSKKLKAYINASAKWYDNIVDLVKGHKDITKSIQTSTVATDANTVANQENAGAQVATATSAKAVGAGMTTAAAGTTALSGALTVLKAALISTGIGAIVVALGALAAKLIEVATAGSKVQQMLKEQAQNRLDIEEEIIAQTIEDEERKWEIEKANGKNELELAKEKYDFYNEQLDIYSQKIAETAELESQLLSQGYKDNNKKAKKWNGIIEFEYAGDRIEKDIIQMEAKLERMADSGNRYFKEMEGTALESFKNIREKGIKTYNDIYNVVEWYGQALSKEKEAYEWSPVGDVENDYIVQAQEILKEAEDYNKSALKLENEAYEAQKKALEAAGKDTTALTTAHWKKVKEIVDSATKGILDRAKAANQTELKNLEDKYKEELAILKEYGKSTTDLTNEYNKQRSQIIGKQLMKETEEQAKAYQLQEKQANENLRLQEATLSEKTLSAQKANEIQYNNLKTSLEGQRDLYKKLMNDETVDDETRKAAKEKYNNAVFDLEKANTDFVIKQVKIRRDELAKEVKDLQDKADVDIQTSALDYRKNMNSTAEYSFKGVAETFWGANQNPSYDQMQAELDKEYEILKTALEAQATLYHQRALDINASEAERTEALQQEALIRQQITAEEGRHYIESTDLVIDKNRELIDTIVSVGEDIGSILGYVADAWEASVDKQIEAGKMSEEEGEKQKEAIRRLQITQAVISTLAGAVGAFAQASATIPPPYGQIVGAAAAASVLASGYAQIAKIKAANENTTESSGTEYKAAIPQTDYNPNYSKNITGASEQIDLQNAVANGMQQAPIYVSVTDINDVQNKVAVRDEESSF